MSINDVEYYVFMYKIPIYKIKPPKDFCDFYETHKDEIIVELDKKNKRLNNIINELEKEMKDIIKEYEIYTKYDIDDIRDLTGAYWYGYSDCADEVLRRLKELKENK